MPDGQGLTNDCTRVFPFWARIERVFRRNDHRAFVGDCAGVNATSHARPRNEKERPKKCSRSITGYFVLCLATRY
jgi:hypothetical protein